MLIVKQHQFRFVRLFMELPRHITKCRKFATLYMN